jgi:hypothetical protein
MTRLILICLLLASCAATPEQRDQQASGFFQLVGVVGMIARLVP